MTRIFVVAVLALLAAACGSPAPTPSASPAASPSTAPSLSPSPAALTIRVEDWTATCSSVPEDDCKGVAALFVNNLARSWKGVFAASGGSIEVESRVSCPAGLPDWVDAASCWQATAPAATGDVCMVIARHPKAEGAISTFGQVGGDDMTGRAGGPPSGWPTCE